MVDKKAIERAIRETLVLGNPQSLSIAVDKIMKLLYESEAFKVYQHHSLTKQAEHFKL